MPKRPSPTSQTSPPSAAIYIRVSTEEQARSGYGLDVQQERCAAMATAKGWTVDPTHMYADEGISGTKTAAERPGLAALLQAVAAGRIHAVIVLALDRLGRKTTIILDLVEQIIAAKQHGWPHPSRRHGRDQRRVFVSIAWNSSIDSFAARSARIDGRAIDVTSALIHNHEIRGSARRYLLAEDGSSMFIALGGTQTLFFRVHPKRRIARPIVHALSDVP